MITFTDARTKYLAPLAELYSRDTFLAADIDTDAETHLCRVIEAINDERYKVYDFTSNDCRLLDSSRAVEEVNVNIRFYEHDLNKGD